MKTSVFSKVVNVATVAVISIFFLFRCTAPIDVETEGDGSGGDGGSGGGGNGGTTISELTIKNNTGYTISGIYIKLSTSTDWGSDLLGYSSLGDGLSKKITFSKPLFASSQYDIRLESSSGVYSFRKYAVAVSKGLIVSFTAGDLNDGSNLPTITVQNRSGVGVNAIYIRPSSMLESSSDWGKDYGSLSNNYDKSIDIPIPPSNYTVFDIQMRSSNPTNTYTKKNITITNGMALVYTSADSDNPLIGTPIIVIQNNTGYTIGGIYIKPSTSTDWGSDLLGYSSLVDRTLRTFTLSAPLSANSVYDIRLESSSSGYAFRKYAVTISDGMIITFTANNLDGGNNLPSITIQNRTGVSFNAIYVKPSEASDWGKDYGSLSNNYDKSIDIPIPPSNYTVFDIQMKSSNPTNTYTRNNVTISNGMVLTYTSADSDNSLIGPPIIVIQNNTGYTISGIYIKPSNSATWGSDLLGYSSLGDKVSRTFALSQSLSANSVYDISLKSSTGGYEFAKYSVTVSEGMIVILTPGDLQQ